MSKNGIKIYKSSKSINSFRKKSSTENINNQIINFANKYASSSSNNIGDTVGDISKCLTSGSNFKINSCSKLNLNNINIFETEKPPTKETKARKDKNGIEINKFNKKKVHITFLDNISPNNKITETIIIQSYKNYNLFDNIPNEENINKCGVCCNIF